MNLLPKYENTYDTWQFTLSVDMIVQLAPSLSISLFGSFGHGVAWMMEMSKHGCVGTFNHLKLDYPLLAEAKIHSVSVLHVESTFVQLGDWVVCVKAGHLFVDLAHHQPGQGHARDAADQLHR